MSGNKVRSLVGFSRKKSCVKDVAPKGWLSSREVAKLNGCTVRAVRSFLHKKQVRNAMVKQGAGAACLYWEREGVMRALGKLPELKRRIPTGWCCAYEACDILNVARSSLSRYVEKGLLDTMKVRIKTSSGVRPVSVFWRSQVRGLKKVCNNDRVNARRLRREQLKTSWESVENRAVF